MALRAGKVSGAFEKRAPGPGISENFDLIFVAFKQGVLLIFLPFSFEHE